MYKEEFSMSGVDKRESSTATALIIDTLANCMCFLVITTGVIAQVYYESPIFYPLPM